MQKKITSSSSRDLIKSNTAFDYFFLVYLFSLNDGFVWTPLRLLFAGERTNPMLVMVGTAAYLRFARNELGTYCSSNQVCTIGFATWLCCHKFQMLESFETFHARKTFCIDVHRNASYRRYFEISPFYVFKITMSKFSPWSSHTFEQIVQTISEKWKIRKRQKIGISTSLSVCISLFAVTIIDANVYEEKRTHPKLIWKSVKIDGLTL